MSAEVELKIPTGCYRPKISIGINDKDIVQMIIKWHTNIKTGIVSSEDGFICQFKKNVLVEISGLPKGISTKEIKSYSIEATIEFEKSRNPDTYSVAVTTNS